MKEFRPYSSKQNDFDSKTIESQILEALVKIEHDFSQKKSMTNKVKLAVVKLGHVLEFKVYARVYSETDWIESKYEAKFTEELGIDKNFYKNKEWLYDVHWYTDVQNNEDSAKPEYMPKTFELACECEWSKHEGKNWNQNRKDIGYDFQKLLFSNAKLNLFVCRCHNDTELNDLAYYFNLAIKNIEQLPDGRRFLIVCFMKMKLYYLGIRKKHTQSK